MIKNKSYTLKNLLLSNEVLNVYINKFWNSIFEGIKDDHHLMIMCKVKYSDIELGYRTLAHLRIVNFEDKELFIEYLTERLGLLNDSYTTLPISKITFSYIIKEGLSTDKDRKLLQDLSDKTLTTHSFNNMVLPISMIPSDYGTIITKPALYDTFTRYITNSNKKMFQIDVSLDNLTNKVRLLGLSDLEWTDTKLSEGFKREIGKSTIYFLDGEIVLRKQQLSAKPFKKLSVDKALKTKFVTMDIETIQQGSKIVPYLICGYNGKDYISSYGQQVEGIINQNDLFTSFFNQLLSLFSKKTRFLIVYAHNLSGFDGVFLLKHLLQFGKVEPLLFNGRLMSIKIKLNIKGYEGKTIIFKDSFLLLPLSLRKLCSAFNISVSKGYFPFLLIDILYKGVLPKLEYWTGISLSDYESLITEYTGKIWSFRDEAIKYCKLDCKTLYEILVKFNELIFNEFQVNIHKTLTLPSLAMRIFKTHFMSKDTIYQILGRVESDIRQSYSGGAVDVYIPHNRISAFIGNTKAIFKKLYYYDVNSLYPTIMSKHLMPVGKPIAFEGEIRKIEPNAYGFFYCKITSPKYLEHPILQRRIKTSDGIRTIAGLGSWEGWICSSEMDNAVKYGYTFEIIRGYQFETADIFSNYVNKMYSLRLQYDKTHAMNLIAKLLLNSLYGKFGMRMDITRVDIFNCSDKNGQQVFKDALDAYGESIHDYIKLDDNFIIIRDSLVDLKYNQEEDMYHGLDVNIAIASTITSGARSFMSIFKNNPLFKLFYSDTDSIVIDAPLPEHLVGNELGQLKLEHVIKKAVFLAPKVYGLIDENGTEIIKIKGINHEVASQLHINELENLLIKDSCREFTQTKWFKKVIEGEINVTDIAYTLKVTSNKRQSIYVDDIFNGTEPYNYNDIIKK